MTVKKLYESFIEDCRCDQLAESTIAIHANMFKRIIAPAIGEIELADLMPIHRNEIMKMADHCGKSAARHAILTFRRMLRLAKKYRLLVGVAPEEIEVPTYRAQHDIRAWSRADLPHLRTLLSRDHTENRSKYTGGSALRAQQFCTQRIRCLFEVMLHSGLRLREALSIDIKNINWETSELRIEDAKARGTWKTVFIHGAENTVKDYLAVRNDNNPALFISTNGKRLCFDTAQSALKTFKERLKKHNIETDSINHKACRATFITIPLEEGVNPKDVQHLAFHSSLHTTLNYYYRLIPKRLKPLHERTFSTL